MFLFSLSFAFVLVVHAATIKNLKTFEALVFGNCEMCKEKIEKAVFQKDVSKGVWNKDTKKIILSFDSLKTNEDILLKKIALVGYDNEKYDAPDNAYNDLPNCCQYKRVKKVFVNPINKND